MTPPRGEAESPYAYLRLLAALLVMTVGCSGMYVMAVALTPVQAEFGVTRAQASLPYTMTMIAFGLGGIMMGRLADRFGVVVPTVIGALGMGAGFVLAGAAQTLWQFILAHSLLIGIGSSASFGPLVADISFWFHRHRGTAVAICASGNYLAGAVWPPILQHFFAGIGWCATYLWSGVLFCMAILLLSLLLRRPRPGIETSGSASFAAPAARPLGLSPNTLLALLCLAGLGCCTAMAMPQVHIVAYCGDLGYGAARGAEMLALMLGCGVVSRITWGWISDRIGGVRTLLFGAALQAMSLALFVPFDGLASLYVVAALFGLFQGGLVPAYAIIIREYFAPREAGARVGIALLATITGMALGGWVSGLIFDLAGSYRAAFVNGVAWSLLTTAIAFWLSRRQLGKTEAMVFAK